MLKLQMAIKPGAVVTSVKLFLMKADRSRRS